MRISGEPDLPSSPRDAIARGVGFCRRPQAGRHRSRLVSAQNLTLAPSPLYSRSGIVSRPPRKTRSSITLSALRIKVAHPDQPIRELSGGNRKKSCSPGGSALRPTLLLVDEPTRGIDLGAETEILDLIAELVAGGLGVLRRSPPESKSSWSARRVVVLSEGRTVAELTGTNIQESALMGPWPAKRSVAP